MEVEIMEEKQTELIPVEDDKLKELVLASDLDSTKAAVLLERFQDYFKIAAELKAAEIECPFCHKKFVPAGE